MKTYYFIGYLCLASCTTTKTTTEASGKSVVEVTSQKLDTPSILDILGGVTKAITTLVGL